MIKKTRLFTPGPTPLLPAAMAALAQSEVHHRTAEFRAAYKKVLEDLHYFYGTKNDILLFTSSGTGAMEGARANIFIEPRKHGKTTEILMQFHDLQEAPKGQAFVLWAVSPDHQFQKLGQIVNIKDRSEARIKSETNFDDFGLLLTTENVLAPTATIIAPTGKRVGVITITP